MIRLALLLMALLAGCGGLERSNPLDEKSPSYADLPQLLIGSWGRNDQEHNEVLVFKEDGSMQRLVYTCHQPNPGDPVDRNSNPPCYTFLGSYFLDGNQLRAQFSEVYSLPDLPTPSLPRTDTVAQISIRRETLTMIEEDGTRSYTRL